MTVAELAVPVEMPSPALWRWRLSPHLLIRVCGLPAATLDALRTPRACSWYAAHARIQHSLAAQGELLRARLEELIEQAGANGNGERVAFINLRRDIFNERKPRAAILERVEGALLAQDMDLMGSWLRTKEAETALRQAGDSLLDEEIAAKLPELQALLADGSLRSAVLLQSEELELQLDRYLTADQQLDKHARRIERSMLELLARAAGKTSPFATLTSVAFGELVDGAVTTRPVFDRAERISHVRANVAITARLAQCILDRKGLRDKLGVALAPGATTERDLIRYVRRRRATNLDGDGTVVLDSVHEELFFLPSGPAMRDLVDIVPQVSTIGELKDRLMAADPERSAESVDELIGHLLRVSFLVVPALQMDLRATDPLRVFIEALEGCGAPLLDGLAVELHRLSDIVAEYRSAPPRDRRRVLALGRSSVQAAFRLVGADPDLAPRVVLYEDVCHGPSVLRLNHRQVGRPLEASLAPLAEILPAFDHRAPFREALVGFFKARYGEGGRCDDFQRFCHEFQRDFFEPFSKRTMRRKPFDDDNRVIPQENWFKSPVVAGLDRARALASELLAQERVRQPGRVVRLGDEYVSAVRDALDGSDAHRQSWSFLSQVVTSDPEGARLVVNQAYAGQTLMFSRFLDALDEGGVGAVGRLRGHLRDTCDGDTVLAELQGGFETTNLNIHPYLTDYEIVCPGDVSRRPAEEQIHLEDLIVEHDIETGAVLLRDRCTGRRVVPVYLGFLMPLSLPEVQQVLLCLSPMGMAQIDLWAGTGEKVVIDGVVHYPRVQLGDLVVHREMWKMPRGEFPLRQPAESRASHFLRVQRWREEHGIPQRVFARVDFMGDGGAPPDEPAADAGAGSPARKPLGVDFSSWYLISLLEQLVLRSSHRIVLTEALPDPGDTWVTDTNGQGFVSELVLELYPERKQ